MKTTWGHVPISVCSGCRSKYHRLGGLYNRHLFPHGCEDWESKVKEPATVLQIRAPNLGLHLTLKTSS